jgi:hypothetical protein
MSDGYVTFKCDDCGHAIAIDESNPPKDDDIYKCPGCGRELGRYAEVKDALVGLAKAEVERVTEAILGKKPTWNG